jgi:MFS family permease
MAGLRLPFIERGSEVSVQEGANGQASAAMEWRRYWPLPVAGMVGYSMLGLQTYAIGPFVQSLEAEFGWSRAEVMLGLTLSNLLGVCCNLAVGMAIDRLGPRRVGIAGLFVKAGAFALLATATGTILNWSLLWVLVAVGAMLTQSTIWSSAVASRFDKGRGLALATALSGTSLCGAISPVLGAWLIGDYGWRTAFAGIGAIWLVFTLPVVFLFYRGRQDELRDAKKAGVIAPAERELPGLTLRQGLRTGSFWKLMLCGASYSLYVLAMAPNLVPLLAEKGSSAMVAAQVAALVGVVAIVARLSAGFLLDVLPAHIVGACIFMLPVLGCGLMLVEHPGFLVMLLAVACFGMTIGAEFDVIIYLTSREFGLKAFGALFGAMLTAGALGGAIGPVTAGAIHDRYGNYDVLLFLLMALMTVSALAVLTIGRPKREGSKR